MGFLMVIFIPISPICPKSDRRVPLPSKPHFLSLPPSPLPFNRRGKLTATRGGDARTAASISGDAHRGFACVASATQPKLPCAPLPFLGVVWLWLQLRVSMGGSGHRAAHGEYPDGAPRGTLIFVFVTTRLPPSLQPPRPWGGNYAPYVRAEMPNSGLQECKDGRRLSRAAAHFLSPSRFLFVTGLAVTLLDAT